MKYTIVLILILSAFSSSAFTLRLIPKDARHLFGMGIVTPDKPSGMTVIYLHGIGERGDGSIPSLAKLNNWGGINLKGDSQSLFAAADHFGFNIICIQTIHDFENGEIPYAVSYAIDSLNTLKDQVHLLSFSLGGFGAAREFGKDPELPRKFASLVFVAMGPGTIENTARNIAESKTPVWFFTSSDDTKSGTNPDVPRNLYRDIKALGGNAWLTEWKSGGHLILGRVCSAWYAKRGEPGSRQLCSEEDALGMNTPAHPVFTWMQNNPKTGKPKAPDAVF
jgi:pimeloyl-ACP methyl ester carboxylesterase